MRYRKEIDVFEIENDDVGQSDYVKESDVMETIDKIEARVNEIISKLKKIEGIDLIDEAKELLDKLSNDLY